MEKRSIPVVGMACSACAANVERRLNSLDGVNEASVSLPGRSALVDFDPDVIFAESFMTADAVYVDESMITGEPTPVEKKEGDKVLAGTIPSQGKLRMRGVSYTTDNIPSEEA